MASPYSVKLSRANYPQTVTLDLTDTTVVAVRGKTWSKMYPNSLERTKEYRVSIEISIETNFTASPPTIDVMLLCQLMIRAKGRWVDEEDVDWHLNTANDNIQYKYHSSDMIQECPCLFFPQAPKFIPHHISITVPLDGEINFFLCPGWLSTFHPLR